MLIEIYTKVGCPACQRTKKILENNGYSYTEYELYKNITREELKKRFPFAKYVPIIIVNNEEKTIEELKLLLETEYD